MFGNHIVSLVTGDEESISELIKNLKKMIAFTLASEPDLRTRNLKVTSATDIVTHINEQLTKLLFSEMDVIIRLFSNIIGFQYFLFPMMHSVITNMRLFFFHLL